MILINVEQQLSDKLSQSLSLNCCMSDIVHTMWDTWSKHENKFRIQRSGVTDMVHGAHMYIYGLYLVGIGSVVREKMTRYGSLWPFALLLAIHICGAEKPYSVDLNSFDPVKDYDSDGKWVDWGTLRMKKVGRNKFALAGDFEFKLNMGDEQGIMLRVFVYDSGAGQKGPLVMNVKKPFCKFVNEDEKTYPYLQKASNMPEQGDCPFPKGQYKIDNYELETEFLPDDAPKGDYLLELTILDKDAGVAGLIAIVTLT